MNWFLKTPITQQFSYSTHTHTFGQVSKMHFVVFVGSTEWVSISLSLSLGYTVPCQAVPINTPWFIFLFTVPTGKGYLDKLVLLHKLSSCSTVTIDLFSTLTTVWLGAQLGDCLVKSHVKYSWWCWILLE